ncbi:uncharacterized protein LOC109799002 [Cajanus cajan]|uniref:uncharacterized protein LOC109799002 n=1 Tax=Cajanus cajan TaxID=3821 RepID=UPI00098DB291|nr:uncharacterized protein LOC109799002 [Cajanus cajan]
MPPPAPAPSTPPTSPPLASRKATGGKDVDRCKLRRRTVARFLEDLGSTSLEEREAIIAATGTSPIHPSYIVATSVAQGHGQRERRRVRPAADDGGAILGGSWICKP